MSNQAVAGNILLVRICLPRLGEGLDREVFVCSLAILLLSSGVLGLKGSVEFAEIEKEGDIWLLETGRNVTMVISYEVEDQDIGAYVILGLSSSGTPPITMPEVTVVSLTCR